MNKLDLKKGDIVKITRMPTGWYRDDKNETDSRGGVLIHVGIPFSYRRGAEIICSNNGDCGIFKREAAVKSEYEIRWPYSCVNKVDAEIDWLASIREACSK